MAEAERAGLMRLGESASGADLGRLCYCANVHPGEGLEDAIAAARTHAATVKAAVSPDAPMGYGLRLAAKATLEAAADPARLAALRAALAETGLAPFTVNGFPYGAFHDQPVKQEVYRPDWRSPERLEYTVKLAEVLAELSDETDLSLSTVPGAFRPDGQGAEAEIADNMIAWVAAAVALKARTGKTVRLAIEPEPECLLETTAEGIAFFQERLYAEPALKRLMELAWLSWAEAEAALRTHLGFCFDVCHAAVEFEDMNASLDALEAAGIPVHKLQLSAALAIPKVDAAARAALAAFDEPVYLHQVVARRADGTLAKHLDLGAALARGAEADGEEWRVHFHAPVFAAAAEPFETTQPQLAEVLARHRARPISPHLEIETYTWGVLPEGLRAASVEAMIAREIDWVRDQLGVAPAQGETAASNEIISEEDPADAAPADQALADPALADPALADLAPRAVAPESDAPGADAAGSGETASDETASGATPEAGRVEEGAQAHRIFGVPAPMSFATALKLGRVSNLPTVWSNAIAAAALSGAAFGVFGVLIVLVALSLSYVGGMWLNDAVDAEIDAEQRANRPIPTGAAQREHVFYGAYAMLGLGWLLLWPFGLEAAAAGFALAAAIAAYDLAHKKTVFSPALMGLCRVGAYWVAGAALGAAGMAELAWLGAAGLFLYVVGLTFAAKQEAYDRIEAVWPLGVLAAPVLLGLWFAWGSWIGMALWLGFAVWTGKCVELLVTRGPGDVPRAVVSLIAGIALYDAVLAAGAGAPGLALVAALGFVGTLALQKVASGT